ncbi:MAG TPA: aldolase [Deltaproteobacteria bacterium]|nr:aldolase [Deltaproteobacteria bacterium]
MAQQLSPSEINVPSDVPPSSQGTYARNYLRATHGTGRLMLFAGDQKIEHLNDDFYGESPIGRIPAEDGDPEHLFRIASQGAIGVFATQQGLISRYGRDYPDVPYLVKLNSKTHLVKTAQRDPMSALLTDVDRLLELKVNNNINIVGVGFTIYVGSENDYLQMEQAHRLIQDAHREGLLAVLWMYPRGQAVAKEKDPHLIAGAAGVAACMGADFAKVNPPKPEDGSSSAEALKEAALAAGRTGLICSGGTSQDGVKFLTQLHDQIHIGGACGNATGRNIHQRPLDEALRLCSAISAVTVGDQDVQFAIRVYQGEETWAPPTVGI